MSLLSQITSGLCFFQALPDDKSVGVGVDGTKLKTSFVSLDEKSLGNVAPAPIKTVGATLSSLKLHGTIHKWQHAHASHTHTHTHTHASPTFTHSHQLSHQNPHTHKSTQSSSKKLLA